jgi:hypothetical protein
MVTSYGLPMVCGLGRGDRKQQRPQLTELRDREEMLWLPHIGLARVLIGKGRHLVHDRVRPGRSHRLADRASSPSITTPSAPS